MADKKTELMAAFFEQCQNHGYTDMHDDRQSLKAKVIATDLNLKYGDIVSFYEKAQKCYDQVQAEKARAEQLRKIQQQKDAEEAARRSVRGELLASIADSVNDRRDTQVMDVYIRPDKSIYTIANGIEIEGAPHISLHAGGVLLTTFHPSQAVYTGATVGGITTGGVHYTKESYSSRTTSTGKGYIDAKIGNVDFTISVIRVSEYTKVLFKRDSNFHSLVSGDRIICYNLNSDTSSFLKLAAMKTDYASQMNVMSVAADERRLSFDKCQQIADLLVRIVYGQFPPSDEEVYKSADALSSASNSKDLSRAIEKFQSISDYKDSADRITALQAKYDEILQAEKEQAILEKEEAHKRNKKVALITGCLIVILTAAILIGSAISKKQKEQARLEDYSTAVAMIEAGEYENAITVLTSLGEYKDSVNLLEIAKVEATNAEHYSNALELKEKGKYEEAAAIFAELKDYKDSEVQAKESDYLYAMELQAKGRYIEAAILFNTIAGYSDAEEQARHIWAMFDTKDIICAGPTYTTGLTSDGCVIATTSIAQITSSWKNIKAISGGEKYILGLKTDGTVVSNIQSAVNNWTDIIEVCAGKYHCAGLKKNGKVVASGNNDYGQLNVEQWTDIVAIAIGQVHTVGLRSDGTVVATGFNGDGRCDVSVWTDIVAISAENGHTVGLKSDGTVVAVGFNDDGQCNVSGMRDVVAIETGYFCTIGVKADGTLVTAGSNQDKQLEVSNWTDIINVWSGLAHTVALKADGTLLTTGLNDAGQCNLKNWTDVIPKTSG